MKLFLTLVIFLLTACSSPEPRAYASDSIARYSFDSTDITRYADSMIGVPYRYGGSSPYSGFDCSGLVSHVFRHVAGISLPRSSHEISRHGISVSKNNLQPGDLVFFNTLRKKFSHVGIYMGNDRFIHAPSSGGRVRLDEMDKTYWRKSYNGARRIQ